MSTVFNNEGTDLPEITVQIKDCSEVLDNIIKKHKEKIFVKLDTEGAEFEIIPLLAERDLLRKIDILIMEYHKKSPKILLDILKENNFVYFYEPNPNDTGTIKAVKI